MNISSRIVCAFNKLIMLDLPRRVATEYLVPLLVSLLVATSAHSAQQDPDADGLLIDQVTALTEARMASAPGYQWQYRVDFLNGTPTDFSQARNLDDSHALMRAKISEGLSDYRVNPDHRLSGSLIYDVRQQRFVLRAAESSPWADGPADRVSEIHKWAFDGRTYTHWERTRHGTELPAETVSAQQIDDNLLGPPLAEMSQSLPQQTAFEHFMYLTGFQFVPGHILVPGEENLGPQRLVSLIERESAAGRLSIETESDEQITLWYVLSREAGNALYDEGHGEERIVEVTLRPDQGGAVSRVTLSARATDGSVPRMPMLDVLVENEQLSDGLWFPGSIVSVNWQSAVATRVTLSGTEALPALTTEDFRLAIPVGTTAHDHVSGLSYVVVNGPVDEAEAMQTYAQTHLGAFRPEDIPRPVVSRRPWIVAAAAILLGVVVWAFWRRPKSTGLLLLSAVIPQLGLASDTAVHSHPPREGVIWRANQGWQVTTPPIAGASISQCGFNVTTLALSAFHREFDALTVSRALKPTLHGISLAAIGGVLEAHGISVQARKAIRIKELQEQLPRNQMCVLALSGPDLAFGHYVTVVKNDEGELILLDPPRGPIVIADSFDLRSQTDGHVGLLLADDRNSTDPDVAVPGELLLNPDIANWKAPLSATIEIDNRSDKHVMITGIRKPCGCVQIADFDPLVHPRSTARIPLTIEPFKWGVGYKQKEIVIGLASGHKLSVVLAGELVADGNAPPDVKTGTTVVNAPLILSNEVLEIPIEVSLAGDVPSDLRCASDRPWLNCSVVLTDSGQRIQGSATITPKQLSAIGPTNSLDGTVEVFAGQRMALRHTIRIVRDYSSVILEPRVPRFEAGRFQVRVQLLVPEKANDVVLTVSPHPASRQAADLQVEPGQAGEWTVSGAATSSSVNPLLIDLAFEGPGTVRFSMPLVVVP